ncbi:5-formyltetrahydrofolate cyclo-ligase [Pedobacter cryoconitis]|uniref:5-formyltetrahydrofolate cyclo-ligase n=1 Tax=Pedobacter cryoconitis TaxID=188932 RepID=A0A7W8ZK21_9SPHI|nr:5-formyltetrahydrofolate cyclo-ligase [Pedobacter cryoconitis]MBB5635471.1 5-formyltetrahydrofolate cyclo-ligase [Pedobacter cryoconitis]MBB6273667.1 5-formyltetrahydrofolate cyclo-ligase [Pedobacter cryoconitis]
MNKTEIRKQETLKRKALSQEQVAVLSEGLLEQFATLDFSLVNTIHIFLPIAEKNEPDTFLFIAWLKKHHPLIKIIVPRADFNTSLMTHHPYKGEQELLKSSFNILEPIADEEYKGIVDLVIVPLLAFDDRGYRVGYGKGFYDRFLEGSSSLKAGLSFFKSVGTIADPHVNDVRLDLCITPDQIFYFKD